MGSRGRIFVDVRDEVSLKLSSTRRPCFSGDVNAQTRLTLFRHQHPTHKNGINSMLRSLAGLHVVFLMWLLILYVLAECSIVLIVPLTVFGPPYPLLLIIDLSSRGSYCRAK